MAHIVLDADKTDKIGRIWESYTRGDITREQLQAFQDTAAIQAGEVCVQCRFRAVKMIIAGEKLCDVCSRIVLRARKQARA